MNRAEFNTFKRKYKLNNKKIASIIGLTHSSVTQGILKKGADNVPIWAKLSLYIESINFQK